MRNRLLTHLIPYYRTPYALALNVKFKYIRNNLESNRISTTRTIKLMKEDL